MNQQPVYECGDGWKKLIDPVVELCNRENVEITQIKEKFGLLRIYIRTPEYPYNSALYVHDKVTDAITCAERASARVCELCGEPGEMRTNRPWIRVLCTPCAVTRELTA